MALTLEQQKAIAIAEAMVDANKRQAQQSQDADALAPKGESSYPRVEDMIAELKAKSTNERAMIPEAISALNRGFALLPDSLISLANTAGKYIPAFEQITEPLRAITGQEGEGIPTVAGVAKSINPAFGVKNFMEPGPEIESGPLEGSTLRDFIQVGGEFAPSAATALVGSAPTVAKVTQNLADDAARQTAIAPSLLRAGDKRVIGSTLDDAGRVVADKLGPKAVDAGFDPRMVVLAKESNKPTRTAMRSMVSKAEDLLYRTGLRTRPSDVPGEIIGKRIQHVWKANKTAGKAVDAAADSLAGKPGSTAKALNTFIDDLSREGVRFSDDLKPSLDGSSFEDLGNADGLIQLVIRRLRNANGDALQMHRLKRFLDKQVRAAKLSEGGIDADLERYIFKVRRGIDDTLDASYDTYKAANDQFRETRQVLDAFNDISPRALDLDAPSAGSQIGTLTRRIYGNAVSRGPLLDSLDDVNRMADKYGMDVSENIDSLASLAAQLDDVFKIQPSNSFLGDVSRGVGQFAMGEKAQAAKTITKNVTDRIGTPQNEQALQAIKDLLAD